MTEWVASVVRDVEPFVDVMVVSPVAGGPGCGESYLCLDADSSAAALLGCGEVAVCVAERPSGWSRDVGS